jgi:hypothetical protein
MHASAQLHAVQPIEEQLRALGAQLDSAAVGRLLFRET